MSQSKVTRRVEIRNDQGLHLRPAEFFARLAAKYDATIEVVKDDHRVDAKSILDILTLAASQGQTLVLEAVGHDAGEAVNALADLVERQFAVDDPTGVDDTTVSEN